MKLSRNVALKINWMFDQLVPPFLRDCRWFMYPPLFMAFGKRAKLFMAFKEHAYKLSPEEYRHYYEETGKVSFERETDLNRECLTLIDQHVRGTSVLEVGCGRGFLSQHLARTPTRQVTGVDILIQDHLKSSGNLTFREANIQFLPFEDHSFDTVISTHTLEHVVDLQRAIRELRRVAKRLILVVPKQRPYRYTFDLHLNFFPYLTSFQLVMGAPAKTALCVDAGGDIFYVEDVIQA